MERRFGEGLRRWREGAGLTRRELARYGPMTEEHLQRLEEGLPMAEASALLHPLGYTLGRAEALLSRQPRPTSPPESGGESDGPLPGDGDGGLTLFDGTLPDPARRALQAGFDLARKKG